MGQKINPIGFRIGSFTNWTSRWFFDDTKKYRDFLLEDIKIRKLLMDSLKVAGITSVEIERLPKSINIVLNVARPGVVIGRGGSGIEEVKKKILSFLGKSTKESNIKVDIQVSEVKNPDLSAHLIANRIAFDLERRMPQRRVVTRTMERVIAASAKGIKVVLAGRIGGADIARTESYHQGSVPSQTLRENIDYASIPVLLKRGYVGIKVWIHRRQD